MLKKVKVLLSLILILSAGLDLQSKPHRERPKIGVVLSGGGAKGFAHIALLEKLEELKIPIDYIGGTSMGAAVAALYSLGYTVPELKKIARETPWMDLFSNRVKRKDRSFFVKNVEDKYPLSLSFGENGIYLPLGLVNGYRISSFLSRLTLGAHDIHDFKNMPIPFFCVATNMETGKEKVFTHGNLSEVLRATMAIPSIFNPVEIDGEIYQDGGIVDNFPVKEIKKMGADIVIGVDVGAPLYTRKELNSIPRILEQNASFLGARKTEEQRALCDILILPDIRGFDSTSFEHVNQIISEGRKALEPQMESLKKLSRKMKGYNSFKRPGIVHSKSHRAFLLSKINFYGLRKSMYGVMKNSFPLKKGERVTVHAIEEAISYSYGSGFFEKISYTLEHGTGGWVLNLFFKENPGFSLNMGLAYDSDVQGSILLNLLMNSFLLKNSSLWLESRVGGEMNRLLLGYLVHTPFSPGIGVGLMGKTYAMDIYLYEEGEKSSSFKMKYFSGNFFLRAFLVNSVYLSLGVEQEFYKYRAEIVGDYDDDTYNFDTMKLYASLNIDTLDNYYYAHRGLFLSMRLEYVRPDFSLSNGERFYEKFRRYVVNSRVALPISRQLTFLATLGGSLCEVENVPPPYTFFMGGYQKYDDWTFPLYGYDFMEVAGQHGFVYTTTLQWQVYGDFYASFRWGQGKAANNSADFFDLSGGIKSGFGLTLGYNSFFGPAQVSVFRKYDKSDYLFHINLGVEY